MKAALRGKFIALYVKRDLILEKKGLGGVSLLEEVCHWVWALKFQKPTPGPALLSLTYGLGCKTLDCFSGAILPMCHSAPHDDDNGPPH